MQSLSPLARQAQIHSPHLHPHTPACTTESNLYLVIWPWWFTPIPTPSPPPAFKTVFKVASCNIDIYQRAYNHSLRHLQSLCWSRTSARCLLCLVGALPVLPYSHFRHSVVMPMCSASLIGILCCVTYLSLLCTLYSIPHQAHTQLAAPARLWYFT